MFGEFVSWWYGPGWKGVAAQAVKRIDAVGDAFSIGTLFKTLFAPWRRVVTYAGAGLDAHFHAAIDNLVSRFIGFLIRIVALLAAGVMILLTLLVGGLLLLLWPIVPFLGIGLIIWGLI